MKLDLGTVADFTRPFSPTSYVRVSPLSFKATPLGMGYGNTRFASPLRSFKVLYVAKNLKTAIAEAIIRDRFEGTISRDMMIQEFLDWAAVSVSASSPLLLLDLRTTGCMSLGVSTDVKGAKAQQEARVFSQCVYDQTTLDGILYRSRLTGTECIAIYDRAVAKLTSGIMVELVRLAGFVPALRDLRVSLIK